MTRVGKYLSAAVLSLLLLACGNAANDADKDQNSSTSGHVDAGSQDAGDDQSSSAGQSCSCGYVRGATCDACRKPCSKSMPCPGNLYCDYPDDSCGDVGQGACAVRPADCLGSGSGTACSCDGTLGLEACIHLNGNDISKDLNRCARGRTFPCGTLTCKTVLEYCEISPSGAGSCKTAPQNCTTGIATCACLALDASQCTINDDAVTVRR